MNIKNIRIAFFLVFVFLASLTLTAFIRTRKNASSDPVLFTNPTPETDKENPAGAPVINITAVDPPDRSENISPRTEITVTFDDVPGQDSIDLTIHPEIPLRKSYSGNKLIVKPETELDSGTLYSFAVKFGDLRILPRTFSFTTSGEPRPPPNTEPAGAAEKEADFLRNERPDIFLSNQTPYTSSSYDPNSEFVGGEGGHFRFTVTSKSENAETDFNDYLVSLGLSATQISRLDVIFQ